MKIMSELIQLVSTGMTFQANDRLSPAIAAMWPIDLIVFLFSRHDLKLLLLTFWPTLTSLAIKYA